MQLQVSDCVQKSNKIGCLLIDHNKNKGKMVNKFQCHRCGRNDSMMLKLSGQHFHIYNPPCRYMAVPLKQKDKN